MTISTGFLSLFRPSGLWNVKRQYIITASMEPKTLGASSAGTLLACRGSSKEILRSTDHGITWAVAGNLDGANPTPTFNRLTPMTTTNWAIGNNSANVQASADDGATWTAKTDATYATYNLTYGAGLLLAVDGNHASYSSDGGATWSYTTVSFLSIADVPTDMIFNANNGYFVGLVDGKGYAYRTTDGVTFEQITMPSARNWAHLAVNPDGIVIAVSTYQPTTIGGILPHSDCKVAISSDTGDTWTESALPFNVQWSGVSWGNGTWVITGKPQSPDTTQVPVLISRDDGLTWVQRDVSFSGAVLGWGPLAFSAPRFVAIDPTRATGSGGILLSPPVR